MIKWSLKHTKQQPQKQNFANKEIRFKRVEMVAKVQSTVATTSATSTQEH